MRLNNWLSTLFAVCGALGALGFAGTASASCGDGVIEVGEACDDGNSVAGDGCAACAVEMGNGCVPTLFATGVNSAGVALPSGALDPHWTWSTTDDVNVAVPGVAVKWPTWTNHPGGRWVSPSANFGQELTTQPNTFWFQRVNVPAAFAGMLTFPIVVACDNECEVFVNGTSYGTHTGFMSTGSISIPATAFVPGANLVKVRLGEQGPGTPRGILIYPGGGGILSQCTEQCANDGECADGNPCTTDQCIVNACTNSAVAAGTSCTGGACNGDTLAPLCIACVDTSIAGTDAGCTMASPHCRTSGSGAPRCEPCLNTVVGAGTDLGCATATPYCVAGVGGNSCVACASTADCVDGNTCTQDICTAAGACSNPPVTLGTLCTGGVCNGAAPALCEVCVDSGVGTDTGCSAATPNCIGASGMRQCVACTTAAQCNDGNACTTDACSALNTCVNTSVAAGSAGACTGSLVCSGAPGNACVACVDTDSSETMTDAGCTAGAPFCDQVGAGVTLTCEVCTDGGAGTDPGCGGSTPNCVVNSGGVNECVSCVSSTDCNDSNECTDDVCTLGMCTNPALGEFSSCSSGVCTAASVCSMVAVSISTPTDNSFVATSMPTLSGTGTPGGTVVITLDGASYTPIQVDASGGWSLTLTSPLGDGLHDLVVELSAGTLSAMDQASFTTDTVTTVTIDSPADGSSSLDATPLIRGTGEPGASILVSVDGDELGTVTVAGDGTWMLTVASALANGSHNITAVATDTLGNTASASSDFDVAANTNVDIVSPANGASTNDNQPVVTGTAQPGASVTVTIDIGGTVVTLGTVVADADGNWTAELEGPLDDGTYVLTATATDLANNMAQDSSSFTVDTQTSVSIVAVDPLTGIITGTGEPGATVVLTVDGVVVGSVVVGSDGSWQLDGDALGAGPHTVTATATDAAGNTATDSTNLNVTMPDGGVVTPDGGMLSGAGGLSGGALCATHAPTGASWPGAAGLLLIGAALVVRRRGR